MATYKDEDGNEVEALTPAEVEAKLEAEKTALSQEHSKVVEEKDTAIKALADEKVALENKIKEAELAGMKEDHPNFKILKEALGKKDDDIKALRTEMDSEKKTRKQESFDGAIKVATRGNDELEKKVKFHLEKTLGAMPDNTADERTAKIQAALTLSGDFGSAGMFDGGINASGPGPGGPSDAPAGPEFTSREKALGAKMGITADDYKKYGNRIK